MNRLLTALTNFTEAFYYDRLSIPLLSVGALSWAIFIASINTLYAWFTVGIMVFFGIVVAVWERSVQPLWYSFVSTFPAMAIILALITAVTSSIIIMSSTEKMFKTIPVWADEVSYNTDGSKSALVHDNNYIYYTIPVSDSFKKTVQDGCKPSIMVTKTTYPATNWDPSYHYVMSCDTRSKESISSMLVTP